MTVDATWYRWLRDLEAAARASGADISESIAEIARKLGSPDGSIDGIPEQSAAQLVGIAPVNVAGSNISLETFAATVAGDIQGLVRDGFGRVTGLRPVVAGPGIVIDGTTDPDKIEISASGLTNPMTSTGDLIRGGTDGVPTRLAIGTNGQVLTVVSGAPAWAAASGGGVTRDAVTALTISAGVVNIDCNAGDFFTLALTANVTSITFTNLPAPGRAVSLGVRIRQDGTGGRTVALPAAFRATTGSDTAVQSAANAWTLLTITTFDQGTRWEYTMRGVAA
jgi:hypothetical protein